MPRKLPSTLTGPEFRDTLVKLGLRTRSERALFCGVYPGTVRRWEIGECPIPRTAGNLAYFAAQFQYPKGSPLHLIKFYAVPLPRNVWFPHLPRLTGPEVRDILSGHGLDTDRKRARFLGVDRQTLGRWETERVPEGWESERESSISQVAINLVRLAERLKRELPPGATLLDLIPPPEPEAPPMPRITASAMTGQQFKDMLTGIGIETDYERARLCGVSRRHVARWRTGKCPIPQTVARLVHVVSLVDCPPDGSILDLIPLGPRPWS